MIGKLKAISLAILMSSFAAGSASAERMPLRDAPQSGERQIINVVFSNYLKDRVGGSIESGVADLDGDGIAEVFARFVHTGSCSEKLERCRTVVLKYENTRWKIVFDRYATANIDLGPATKRIPRPFTVDETSWEWAYTAYSPKAEGLGSPVSLADVPASMVASYSSAFGPGAVKLAESKRMQVTYSNKGISKKNDVIILKQDGKTLCSDVYGCPIRILKKNGETWQPVLSAYAKGNILISKTERDGYRDIVTSNGRGFSVYGWNGSTYAIADRIERVKE